MKKLFAVLFAAALCVVLSISASAELYSPEYYGVKPVNPGDITLDGKVDEAYGDPIFYYVADKDIPVEEAGEIGSTANWYFTQDQSEENLFLLKKSDNYVYGYAAWSDNALYLCFDTNIEGWHMEGVAADGSDMWKAYCFQVGFFDFNNDSNVDWGVGVAEDGHVLQYNFGMNNGSGKPTMISGVTDYDAQVVRDGDHVIYEYELTWDVFLSFKPTANDYIGMDVCLDLCNISKGGPQRCLTFVNTNYHERKSENARKMYFLAEGASLEDVVSAAENKKEMTADEHNIPAFGCNEDVSGFVIDTENKKSGYACLTREVGKGFVSEFKLPAAIDVSKMDTFEFDLYVSDIALFDKFAAGGMDSGFEITSAGTSDKEETAWHLKDIKENNKGGEIKQGWNHIILPLSTGAKTGDTNFGAVNYFRFFMVNEAEDTGITVKLDNFKFTDYVAVATAAIQAEADEAIAKINKIAELTADNYKEEGKNVSPARRAYDKLSDEAKALVPADVLKKLTDAEAKLDELKNPPATDAPATDAPGTEAGGKETDAPKNNGEKSNTGLIIGIVAAVVVVAAVVAILLAKKKK